MSDRAWAVKVCAARRACLVATAALDDPDATVSDIAPADLELLKAALTALSEET